MQKYKPDHYNDLNKIYSKVWNLLNTGVKNRNSQFHVQIFISSNNNKFNGIEDLIIAIDKKEKKI